MPDLETWTEGCKDSNCKLFITLFGKEPPLEDLNDTEAFEENYDEVMDLKESNDIMYHDVLSGMEKKQFYNALLTDILIYEDEQDKGQIIKSIGFKFPVFYDGEFTKRIIRDKEKTVENICLLLRKVPV